MTGENLVKQLALHRRRERHSNAGPKRDNRLELGSQRDEFRARGVTHAVCKPPRQLHRLAVQRRRLLRLAVCAIERDVHFDCAWPVAWIHVCFDEHRIVRGAYEYPSANGNASDLEPVGIRSCGEIEFATISCNLTFGKLWELDLKLAEVLVVAHRAVGPVRLAVAYCGRDVLAAGPERVDVELYAELPRTAVDHAAEASVAERIPRALPFLAGPVVPDQVLGAERTRGHQHRSRGQNRISHLLSSFAMSVCLHRTPQLHPETVSRRSMARRVQQRRQRQGRRLPPPP